MWEGIAGRYFCFIPYLEIPNAFSASCAVLHHRYQEHVLYLDKLVYAYITTNVLEKTLEQVFL